jgi:hypothetical protein
VRVDDKALFDLSVFAEIEVNTHDVEPWAEIIRALHDTGYLIRRQSVWLATLYNTYDDLNSAWVTMRRWPTIWQWDVATDKADIATFNCTQERRNLRGGRVIRRMQDYAAHCGRIPEETWMRHVIDVHASPGQNFADLTRHMRTIWGVGRQSAFEWAEFMGKVVDLPVDAADGQLFDSSGPRRCLERIFGLTNPDPATLQHAAEIARDYIRDATGIDLPWVDFETIICDFNVMRDGRYYPGRHLAALREEIEGIVSRNDRLALDAAWRSFVPTPWAAITPGIDKTKLAHYATTGRIICRP